MSSSPNTTHILTNLYRTKYNKINIYSDVQKYLSHTRSHKIFLKYYGLYLETAENVFSTEFHGL